MPLLLDTRAFLWWNADDPALGPRAELAIEVDHAIASAELPRHHRDPFDRLLIAQARLEELTLVTNDAEIVAYDVETLDASL